MGMDVARRVITLQSAKRCYHTTNAYPFGNKKCCVVHHGKTGDQLWYALSGYGIYVTIPARPRARKADLRHYPQEA